VRGRAARSVVPALAVLALVGVVSVAATGSTPTGTSDGRRPSDTLLDTFFSLGLLLLVPGAALLVYGLMQRKEIAQEIASRRHPRTSMLAFVVFLAIFTGVIYYVRERGGFLAWRDLGEIVEVGPDGTVTVRDASASDRDAYRAEFAWIPVAVVVGLAGLGAAAYLVASRRRAAVEAAEHDVAEQLAAELDDTLDDLRAEPDPRRAVVAAFARLERALAAAGVPRAHSETADEYVSRVLGMLEVDDRAVRRLSELFARAKFSQHQIDVEMKRHAIDALERVRDGLRLVRVRPQGGDVTGVQPDEALPA